MGDRVFVTGGSGRIGRELVRNLAARGHEVAALARTDAAAEVVRQAGATTVVRAELADVAAVADGLRGARRIYHLAGGKRGAGRATPEVLNTEGTRHLLAAVQQAGTDGLESLLYASSWVVYGDRSSLWVEEDFRPSPNTVYGRSKVDAENLLQDAFDATRLPVVVARIAAVYGKGFPFLMDDRIREGVGWLPGEGRNNIPVVHLADAVAAMVTVAERGERGEVYHVADQSTPSLSEFYGKVHALVGGQPMRFWSTWIPSYVQLTLARRNEALQTALGTRPRFTPDNYRIFTSSVRLKVRRLEKELGFAWDFPTYERGLEEVLSG